MMPAARLVSASPMVETSCALHRRTKARLRRTGNGGGCGRGLVERVLEEDHRPRLICPDGHVTWRNPRLVVGTLPVRDGRVYLARRSIEPGVGRWTYPGGYLEVGEAAQEGARRETEGETRLLVEGGRLIGAYSRA